MAEISKEYVLLFNAITETEQTLRQLQERLMFVQRQAEELYLQAEEEVCEEERRISRMLHLPVTGEGAHDIL